MKWRNGIFFINLFCLFISETDRQIVTEAGNGRNRRCDLVFLGKLVLYLWLLKTLCAMI